MVADVAVDVTDVFDVAVAEVTAVVFVVLVEVPLDVGLSFSSDSESDEPSSDDDVDDDDEEEDGFWAGLTVEGRGVVGGDRAVLAARRLFTVTTGDRGDSGDLV